MNHTPRFKQPVALVLAFIACAPSALGQSFYKQPQLFSMAPDEKKIREHHRPFRSGGHGRRVAPPGVHHDGRQDYSRMSSNSQSLRHQTFLALLQPIEAELEMLLGCVMGHLSRARHKMRGALRPLAKSELA